MWGKIGEFGRNRPEKKLGVQGLAIVQEPIGISTLEVWADYSQVQMELGHLALFSYNSSFLASVSQYFLYWLPNSTFFSLIVTCSYFGADSAT
jgi:hypothetical protein